MTGNLFAYGTLMEGATFSLVTGLRRTGEAARLAGYRRGPLHGEAYPGLVRQPGRQVDGVLYRDITPRAWRRLDHFEGRQYRRRRVGVSAAGGPLRAFTYVLRPRYRARLAPGEWHYDDYLRDGRSGFVAGYRGFHGIRR